MTTPAVQGADTYPLVPAALERSRQTELSALMQSGITPDEIARARQTVEAWRQRYRAVPGIVPTADAHAWQQASYYAQAVQNNFILQQLRAGLASGNLALLRATFEEGNTFGGLRESVGAMSRQELHALATSLDGDGEAVGSRRRLAEHLMTYPGVQLDESTRALLRASLPVELQPRFDASYRPQ